jgi:catechol 2,3-dioxygenase-like lactoylglutathione lyase family enzyme
MNDPFRVHGIDHVELFVPDRREAAEWYGRVLGLEVMRAFEFWAEPGGGPLIISPDGGRTKLALFEGTPASRATQTAGIHRIAFGVDAAGFLAFLDRLESLDLQTARGRRVTPADVVDHARAFSIYFTDPWGTPLEVTSYDHEPIRAAVVRRAESSRHGARPALTPAPRFSDEKPN